MLIEMRLYTTHPGQAAAFAKLYQDEGLPIQLPVGGNLTGFYRQDVGDPNQVILIWQYKSYEDRLARRDELFKIPEWLAFLQKAAPLVQSEENKLLTAVS
jgi:hypothetical protein|tara:strand:+ start:723 stop:1022 length:300 start_codon:yes stop_codon:yes gene_type:complete